MIDRLKYHQLIKWQAHSTDVHCVTFNGDGTKLASSSSDGRIKVWRSFDGWEIASFTCTAGWAKAIAFWDNEQILFADFSGQIKIWNFRDQSLKIIAGNLAIAVAEIACKDNDIAISDRRMVMLLDHQTGSVRVVDAVKSVWGLQFNGHQLTQTNGDASTKSLLDAIEGVNLINVQTREGYCDAITFSRDQTLLLCGTSTALNRHLIQIYETKSQKLRQSLMVSLEFNSGISCLDFSPDGKKIAVGNQGTVLIYEGHELKVD